MTGKPNISVDQVKSDLIDLLPGGFFQVERSGVIISVSLAAVKMLGYTEKSDLIGQPIVQFYRNPKDREKMIQDLKEAGGSLTNYELDWIKRDGEPLIGRVSVKAVLDDQGNIVEIHGIVFDQTHSRMVEEANREMSEMNDHIMQTTDSAVAIFRPSGEIVSFNDTACNMVGATREVFGKVNFKNLDSWKACTLYSDAMKCLDSKMKTHGRTDLVTKIGNKTLYVDYAFSIIHQRNQEYLMIVLNDLTEERISDRAIAQAEQLSLLGELAAGIAHEINNPLAIIMTLSGFMKSQTASETYTPDKKKLNEMFAKIEATSERIGKIVRGLRSMSRASSNDPYAVESMQLIIDNVVELTRFKFKTQAVQFIPPENVTDYVVECHESQIVQIIVNLVNNAYDALMASDQKEKIVKIEVINQPEKFEIRVIDNGPGIPPQVKERLMTPFYTTKPKGKGTGLGLSLSKKLAKAHGGDLYLDDQIQGTCFVLILPKRQPTALPQAA